VTAFEELERGDVVWASDPLSEKGRPMLVLGAPEFPSHGPQLITALISTKTYHDESIVLRDDDYDGEPLEDRSHVLPWSVATLTDAEDVELHLTALADERLRDVTARTTGYIDP
jgi:mRNA-degrading endonuclease toxin of MazEF toxin-antitoxin module